MKDISQQVVNEALERKKSRLVLLVFLDTPEPRTDGIWVYAQSDEPVVYQGVTYQPLNFEVSSFSQQEGGNSASVNVTVNNLDLASLDILSRIFMRTRATFRTVSLDLLRVDGHHFDEIFYLQGLTYNLTTLQATFVTRYDLVNFEVPSEVVTREEFPGLPENDIYV